MPSHLFPPLTEEEKAFQPILHTFLANADTQGLRNIVDKHSREAETVARDLAVLRESFNNLQSQCNEDRRSSTAETVGKELAALREAFNIMQSQCNEDHRSSIEDRRTIAELRGTVEKLQGGNTELRMFSGELRAEIGELKKINDKLRDANTKLQSNSEKAVEQVSVLEKIVGNQQTAVEDNRTANQDLRNRLDQLCTDTLILKDLPKQLRQCDARIADNEFRQQNVEEVIEKLANLINGPPPSPELPQEASQEVYQDPYAQSSHHSRKRHYTHDRDDELANPQYGEGSKRQARDIYQDDVASRPAKASQRPPPLARQDAVRAEGSTQHQPRIQNAQDGDAKRPEANGPDNSDEINPRWVAIKRHYNASKKKFAASKPKNHRIFIWGFIEGSGDQEFSTWFQEHLLEALPSDKVSRSAKKYRNPGDRVVALGRSLTWEEVRQVIREMPVPQFLE